MKARRMHFLDRHLGNLLALDAALLYLVLLAGRESLGKVYGPVAIALVVVLAALMLRWLVVRAHLVARLRAEGWVWLLAGEVLLALILRLLWAQRPAPAPGSDEAYFAEAVLGIIRSGNYAPASLRYPTLFTYGELGVGILRFFAGVSANLWTWPVDLRPEHLYGWGRALVALLGAATLVPVYRLGERLYGRRAGLLAALFLALLPLHVAAGGLVTPEVLAALLATLTLWFALRFLEEGASRWAWAAGLSAGLAAATHYPAGLALGMPLGAALIRSGGRPRSGAPSRPTGVLFSLVGALLGFLAGCPLAIFKVEKVASGLAEAARAYFPAQGTAGSGLRYLLWEGVGIGPAALVLLGLLLVLPRFRRQEAVLLIFPLITYLALLLPRARLVRDWVLLAPWLALLAGVGVERAGAYWEQKVPDRRIRRWLPWAVALVAGGVFGITLLLY